MNSEATEIEFRPVQLPRDAETCLLFARDMAACNGGDSTPDAENDAALLDNIAVWQNNDPYSCLHVWHGDDIVGQLHLGRVPDEPVGYVHFFYVAPAWRGTEVAAHLDNYAMKHFAAHDLNRARLSVTVCNQRALNFYRRRGWRDGANRADKPGAIYMERESG